ncbi:MAG TPA: hypothetical protein PKE47_00830 [Verrucomicrobiota bacterium]|nr:hypothetical protein [Verrucomicrobiota bacterium]
MEPASSPLAAGGDDAARRTVALQRQVNVLTFVLLVLAASVGVFMLRQVQLARRQANALQHAGQQVLAHYTGQIQEPAIRLEQELRALADTRPALAQFMGRFGPGEPPPAPSAPASP